MCTYLHLDIGNTKLKIIIFSFEPKRFRPLARQVACPPGWLFGCLTTPLSSTQVGRRLLNSKRRACPIHSPPSTLALTSMDS